MTKCILTRNIIWYNPPLSRNVATKICKTFLKVVDEEFPLGHTLHKKYLTKTHGGLAESALIQNNFYTSEAIKLT